MYVSFLSFVIISSHLCASEVGWRHFERGMTLIQIDTYGTDRKCRHSYSHSPMRVHAHSHLNTHTHKHSHTYADTLLSDMKVYRKPLSLKDNERRKNKNTETVKVQIHQTDHFVLYNTLCCFASDQQPLK